MKSRQNQINIIFWFLFALIFSLTFHDWFNLKVISAGDLDFFYPVNIREHFGLPLAWQAFRSGLGGNSVLFQGSYFYNIFLGGLGRYLNIGFPLAERIVWLFPLLLLSIFSARYFHRSVSLIGQKYWPLTYLILFFNTYFLMVVGGGQITVALALSLFPLLVGMLLGMLKTKSLNLKKVLFFSLVLALYFALDFRFAYLFFLFTFLLFGFRLVTGWQQGFELKKWLSIFLPAGVVLIGLNLFWLVPLLKFPSLSLAEGYASQGWVEFLSLTDFSKSLSLLHPNWPENIFGKTYFMKPEFLLLPILAYSSLLFAGKFKKQASRASDQASSFQPQAIAFFVFLGLVGSFLGKGSRPPLSGVYTWLFNNFPGWFFFRDATKFYVLTMLSYSVLIPFSLVKAGEWLKNKFKKEDLRSLPGILFLIYLIILICPVWEGENRGAFKAVEVPLQSLDLKDFIAGQDEYFRIFWVPKKERFGYYSNQHPAINAQDWVTDTVCREPLCSLKVEMPDKWGQECPANDRCYVRELGYFLNPETEKLLREMAVKYVIVPYDSRQELFIAEWDYNPQQREEVESFFDTIFWLKKIDPTDTPENSTSDADESSPPGWKSQDITIYEVSDPKDHFFLSEDRQEVVIDWQMINPAKYLVRVKNPPPYFGLVFSENFDRYWQAKVGDKIISSQNYRGLNRFSFQDVDQPILIEYRPQKYIYRYGVVSIIFLLTILSLIFMPLKKKRKFP